MKELSELDKRVQGMGNSDSEPSDGMTLIDQDTAVTSEGETVRLSGIAAPEISHLDPTTLQESRGQIGGDTATMLGQKAIDEEGFKLPALTGQKGYFGRSMGDFTNDEGVGYSKFLLNTGAGYVSKYANTDDVVTSAYGNLERAKRKREGKSTEWDILVENHNDYVSQGALSIKPFAANEAIYAAAPDLYAGVSIRDNDRTLNNETKDWQLGQAWDMGISHGLVGMTTSIGMVQEVLGVDSMDNWGYAHADALKREIEDAPYMRDMVAFDKNGEFTLDGISELTNYTFSNFLTSLPVMAVGIASVVAIPATLGTSLAAPLSIYTGNNFDAQDDKDMGKALMYSIGMTALDVVGVKLGGAFKPTRALGENLTTKAGRNAAVEAIALAGGITKAQAKPMLAAAMRDTAGQSAKQIRTLLDGASSILVKSGRVASGTLQNVASEGITEAMQEYLAIQAEGNEVTPEEQLNRLMNAGFAGGMLGGSMGAAGQGMGALTNANIIAGMSSTTNEDTNARQTRAMDARNFPNRVMDVDAVLQETTAPAIADLDDATRGGSLKEMSEASPKEDPSNRIDRTVSAMPGLIRGQLKNTLAKYQGTKFMSMMGTILGVNNARGGLGFEDKRRSTLNRLTGKKRFDGLKTSTDAGYRGTKAFSDKMYKNSPLVYRMFEKMNNGVDINTAAASEKSLFNTTELEFLQEVYDTNAEINDSFNLENSVVNKTVSRHEVHKNQEKLAAILVRDLNITQAEAQRAITLFLQNDQYATPLDLIDPSKIPDSVADFLDPNFVNTIENTFSKMDGASAFLDNNIFNNVINNSSRYANRSTYDAYIGDDGSKLANILDLAQANNEITGDQKIALAKELQDYLDQLSGDYHRVDSKAYRNAINNLSFLTAMTALPLAAISSIVEIGFVLFQNNPAPMKTAFIMSKVAAAEMQATMNEGLAVLTRGKIPMKEYTHRELLRKGGYLLDSQAPAARQGAEVSPRQAGGLGVFFKASGLTGLTNIQRYARLAMAEDTVSHWASQALAYEGTDNRYYSEAIEQLGNLGANPDVIINAHKNYDLLVAQGVTPDVAAENTIGTSAYREQMENAKIKFVDMAVAMPQIGNRPKFYSDPRYRLFTQFQGYISTATATLLPIMYGNLGGKEKMPIARANALATLASLIALSFMAQAMKDSAKTAFADDEAKERKKDYLNDWQTFLRAMYGSGAIGVLERPIDFVMPLYGDRPTATGNALGMTGIPFAKSAADNIIGEAPGLSYLDNAFKATYDVATQDKNALRNVTKITPMVAPFKDWWAPYKGDK